MEATPTAPIGSCAALSSTVSVSPPSGARNPPSTKILPSQAARCSSSCIGVPLSSIARADNVCHTVATRVAAWQDRQAMASLADISRRAGTSVATASRVLNGSTHPVSEATRARVMEAAADLGYQPSALARALVTRSSRIIGVIVNDIVDPYFAEIARGVEDVAGRSGHLVMVCNADHRVEAESEYVAGPARLPRRGAGVRRLGRAGRRGERAARAGRRGRADPRRARRLPRAARLPRPAPRGRQRGRRRATSPST